MLPPPEDCDSEADCEIDWGDNPVQEASSPEVTDKRDETKETYVLSSEDIAEMIEVSFVNACMQLAQGYVDVLKLFIVGAKAGYEKGIAVPVLLAKVADCPIQSANRPLMKEEEDLRTLWVNLVYFALGTMKHSSDDATILDTIDENTSSKFGMLVSGVVQSTKKTGIDNTKLKIQSLSDIVKILGNDIDFSELESSAGNDPVQNAIISQSIKLVGLTMTVLEEEQICFEGGGQGTPPRPPIPGAF